jgi:hypothetical protein
MGRKGVSKRKPKKSTTNDNNKRGSSNARPGKSLSPVRSLVDAKDAPLNRGSTNPSAGSKKKNRKGR